MEIDPADPRGPLAVAEARTARGDHRGAVSTLEPLLAALRSAPDTGVYARVAVELAAALEASGERDRGVRVLEDARTRDERNVEVRAALGAAYVRAERHDAAERVYRDLLAADADNPAYLDHLGDALFGLKRYRDAVVVWDRVLAGARTGIDADAVTKKRDRARQLAGRE